jgi:hypothetical protein
MQVTMDIALVKAGLWLNVNRVKDWLSVDSVTEAIAAVTAMSVA